MALANVADRLCRLGLKTLIIDFDLEAPGIERYFPIDSQTVRQSPGLLDLLITYKHAMSQPVGRNAREFQKLERYIFPVYHELPGGGRLHLLPAGTRGDEEQLSNYAYRLRTFDWQEFYFDWGGELFFQWLAREVDKNYDLGLVDSRTGVTEMGGVCAYQLADTLVMFCATNSQNLQGTREVLTNFNSERVRALRKDRPLQVLVVPSRVQQDSPELETYRREFGEFENFAPPALKKAGLSFWNLMIPYDPAFAFQERVAGESAESGNQGLPRVFEQLALTIASMGGEGSKAAEVGKRLAAMNGGGSPTSEDDGGHQALVEPEYDATTSFAGFDVFISYHRKDAEVALRLTAILEDAGCQAYVDREQLTVGDSWVEAIRSALARSAAVLVLVGSELSTWQVDEFAFASQMQRRIIPVLLPGGSMETVPAVMRSHQFIDLRAGIDERVLDSLVKAVRGPAKRASKVVLAEENPYVGLRSFDERDRRFFFGRDAMVAQGVRHLRANPFLAIVGASGSGKSTLVRAGIIPRLRAGGSDHRETRFAMVRPGTNPMRSLAQSLVEIEGVTTPDEMERELMAGASISSLVRLRDRLVVVVDQLEELWRLPDRNERMTYLALLASVEREDSNVVALIVVLRADFYGETTELRQFGDLVSRNQLLVGPMSLEELRQAIERPAQGTGLSFEPGLVERILNDLGDSSSPLPLLQVLLARLWADRQRGFITHESYERCGGLRILSLAAEEAYQVLPDALRPAARTVFLKLLSPERTRNAIPMHEFSEAERTVVEALVEARLLRTSLYEHSSYVELVHDAIAREWDRFAQWVAEDRDALQYRALLQSDVSAWTEMHRSRDRLYRGQELVRAQQWLEQHAELASSEQHAFIEAAHQQHRRIQQLSHMTLAITVLLVFALVAGAFSLQVILIRVDRALGEVVFVSYRSAIRRGVIVDREGSAYLFSGLTGSTKRVASNVWTAVLSPDADSVAVATHRGSIDVVDTRSGETRLSLDPGGKALCLAISDDGRGLAAGTVEGTVRIWSLPDGHLLASAEPKLGPVQTLRFAGTNLIVNANAQPIHFPRP